VYDNIEGVSEVILELVDVGKTESTLVDRPPILTPRAMVLVQALPGRGKTTFATKGGRPLILAVEPKTAAMAHHHNPAAKVYPIDSRESLERAIAMLCNPILADRGYDRVVLDSYSELTERIPSFFGMSYPLQIQDYGSIGNKALAIITALQKCPLPSLVICRSEAKEQGKVNRMVPSANGRSAASLPARCVCTAETRYDEREGWVIDTSPDEWTQRSGLPWVPGIWRGSADEFIAMVERGPIALPSTESAE